MPPIVHEVLRSPGQPLNAATRAFMEPRFGHDFSHVRLHSDAKATESARAVNAEAYVVGQHVVVRSPEVSAQTVSGRWLLAHELAHTIQQRNQKQTQSGELSLGNPSSPSESEADASAGRVVAGTDSSAPPLTSATTSTLQRFPFGISLPTGLRWLDKTEKAIATSVYGSSLNFFTILLSNALGGGGRPFTTYVGSLIPSLISLGGTIINIGPSAYATPGSDPNLLIHELAHSWQSQHHPVPAAFMSNSIASQAGAAVAGGSAYCYVPGKWFGLYGAEQIAQQVEKREPAIVSHVSSRSLGIPDPANMAGLAIPRWETSGAPGVVC